ncbi:MAG TPA: hypothetical protein VF322_15700 [Gammaproteobacteria bacterium]
MAEHELPKDVYLQRIQEVVDDIVVMLAFARRRGTTIPEGVASALTELLRQPELRFGAGEGSGESEVRKATLRAGDFIVEPVQG